VEAEVIYGYDQKVSGSKTVIFTVTVLGLVKLVACSAATGDTEVNQRQAEKTKRKATLKN
jgi:hypothetical protein